MHPEQPFPESAGEPIHLQLYENDVGWFGGSVPADLIVPERIKSCFEGRAIEVTGIVISRNLQKCTLEFWEKHDGGERLDSIRFQDPVEVQEFIRQNNVRVQFIERNENTFSLDDEDKGSDDVEVVVKMEAKNERIHRIGCIVFAICTGVFLALAARGCEKKQLKPPAIFPKEMAKK